MEQTSETKSLVQKHYLLIVVLAMAAVAVVGIITMQLLAAALAVVLIVGIALIVRGRWRSPQHPRSSGSFEAMDDTSIIIAAALFAFIGMALSVWVVWAVALAVLFFIQQSLARIEGHLAALAQAEKAGGSEKP